MSPERINVDKPLWDQSSFYGRFRHFVWLTNPLNCLHGSAELHLAKELIEAYRDGKEPPGTSQQQVLRALRLTKSSFHPDSGELQNVFGRMSFQVPGGMLITGAMLHFYKSMPQVIFWQWFNQSFNALVNYTNRNANSPTSPTQLGAAYALATSSALGTAIGLNKSIGLKSHPMIRRFVPFAAVAAANCVNIPLMRYVEITDGIDLKDPSTGETVCKSRYAAALGITCVVFSRIVITAPGMIAIPVLMDKLEKVHWFRKRKLLHVPFQVLGVGAFLCLMVPLGCAIFPQVMSVSRNTLQSFDAEAYNSIRDKSSAGQLTFNKGL